MEKFLDSEQARAAVEKVAEMTAMTAFGLTVNTERKPGLCDTKFGGVPYWDSSKEYPELLGDKLMLLAQINLSDLGENEYLPDHGLLQFFILCDDVYGCDFDNQISNDTFRVIYHESIDESVTEQSVLALEIPTTLNSKNEEDNASTDNVKVFDTDMAPFYGEFAVDVRETTVSMGMECSEYDECLSQAVKSLGIKLPDKHSAYTLLPDEVAENECAKNAGHWVLGYPYFTQSDPREYAEALAGYDVLLFQMDTDNAGKIMWGDCGVANFFIRSEDLKKLDFSKVLYNWDCC